MNLNIRWKNVKKALAIGGLVLIVVSGIKIGLNIYNNINNMNNHEDKAKLTQMPVPEDKMVYDEYYNGVHYRVPDSSYSLMVINGNVCAVKHFYMEREPEIGIHDSVVKIADEIEIDGKVYRIVTVIKDPIIVKETNLENKDSEKIM